MEVNNKTVPVTGQQDQNTISLDLICLLYTSDAADD